MDSVPPWRAQAVVTLSNLDQRTPCAFPERKIFLTRDFAAIPIGRTSKRNSSLEALVSNCWFDSAVMSREHARLRFDAKYQKIYVSDVGSLHGTFLNEHALVPHEAQELREGDILRFGIPIERGRDVYSPIAMEVAISYGSVRCQRPLTQNHTSMADVLERINDQPTIFRVPDETDVEDVSGDEECAIQHSSRLLQQHNIRPAPCTSSSKAVSIDLTGNDSNSAPAATIVNLEEALATKNVSSEEPTGLGYPSHIDLTSQDGDDSSHETENTPAHAPQQHREEITADSKDESRPDIADMFEESDDADYNVDDGSDSELESMSEASNSDMLDGLDRYEDESSPLFVPEEEFEDHSDMDAQDMDHLEHEPSLGRNHEKNLSSTSKNDDASLEPKGLAPSEIAGNSQVPLPLVQEFLAEEESQPTIQPQCLWTSPPLPSMLMAEGGKLPNLTQLYNTFPQGGLANVRLPSIFETMPNTHSLQPPTTSKSTAEIMGEKTGKYEYFYARADNSTIKFKECPFLDDEQVSTFQTPLTKVPQGPIQTEISGGAAQGLEAPEQHNPWCQEPPSTTAADTPGPWSSSGNKFLTSPLPNQGCEDVQDPQNVLLDDTSAYQYEVSKKVANASTPCAKAKEGLMTINNLVEPPCDRVKSPEPPSTAHKRKIDEISDLTAEEGSREAEIEGTRPDIPINPSVAVGLSISSPRSQPVGAQEIIPSQVDFLRSGLPRPVKRLRRMAEVVGIAAIGGAFVMSALIATAPAL